MGTLLPDHFRPRAASSKTTKSLTVFLLIAAGRLSRGVCASEQVSWAQTVGRGGYRPDIVAQTCHFAGNRLGWRHGSTRRLILGSPVRNVRALQEGMDQGGLQLGQPLLVRGLVVQ